MKQMAELSISGLFCMTVLFPMSTVVVTSTHTNRIWPHNAEIDTQFGTNIIDLCCFLFSFNLMLLEGRKHTLINIQKEKWNEKSPAISTCR